MEQERYEFDTAEDMLSCVEFHRRLFEYIDAEQEKVANEQKWGATDPRRLRKANVIAQDKNGDWNIFWSPDVRCRKGAVLKEWTPEPPESFTWAKIDLFFVSLPTLEDWEIARINRPPPFKSSGKSWKRLRELRTNSSWTPVRASVPSQESL